MEIVWTRISRWFSISFGKSDDSNSRLWWLLIWDGRNYTLFLQFFWHRKKNCVNILLQWRCRMFRCNWYWSFVYSTVLSLCNAIMEIMVRWTSKIAAAITNGAVRYVCLLSKSWPLIHYWSLYKMVWRSVDASTAMHANKTNVSHQTKIYFAVATTIYATVHHRRHYWQSTILSVPFLSYYS